VITASVGGPLLGFWLVGWPGVLVGLFLGGLGFFLGPYAVTKVKEIRR